MRPFKKTIIKYPFMILETVPIYCYKMNAARFSWEEDTDLDETRNTLFFLYPWELRLLINFLYFLDKNAQIRMVRYSDRMLLLFTCVGVLLHFNTKILPRPCKFAQCTQAYFIVHHKLWWFTVVYFKRETRGRLSFDASKKIKANFAVSMLGTIAMYLWLILKINICCIKFILDHA